MIPSVDVSVVAVSCLDTGSLGATLFCETWLSRQQHISYHRSGGGRVQRTTAVFRPRDHIKHSLATSLAIHESPFNNIVCNSKGSLYFGSSSKSKQLPTENPTRSVEATSKLPLWLHNLSLEDCILDDVLAVIREDSRKPDALSSTILDNFGVSRRRWDVKVAISCCPLHVIQAPRVFFPVHHHIGRIFVSTNMADKVDSHTAWPLIIKVPEETQRPQMPLQFFP